MNIDHFRDLPILGILRGIEADIIEPLTESIVSSGLKTIEITMNTTDAPNLIKEMIRVADGRLSIGAGTVLTMDDLHQALDAGATFVVMPTLVPDVLDYCTANTIPAFPGAFTPQEVHNAWKAGATMVKVFPTTFVGPEYIKELKGPFGDVELLACGGVTPESIHPFFKSGASAVAFGGSVFKSEWLQKRDFSNIEDGIKKLITEGGMI